MWAELAGGILSSASGAGTSMPGDTYAPSLGPVTVGGLNAPAYPFSSAPAVAGFSRDSLLIAGALLIGALLLRRSK